MERGGFEPPVPRGLLWAGIRPEVAYYSARQKASVPERNCSPVIHSASALSGSLRSPGRRPTLLDARAKGWPAELLWNAGFSDCLRGLAAVVDPDDEIVEVTSDTTPILKCRRDLLSFRRHIA